MAFEPPRLGRKALAMSGAKIDLSGGTFDAERPHGIVRSFCSTAHGGLRRLQWRSSAADGRSGLAWSLFNMISYDFR